MRLIPMRGGVRERGRGAFSPPATDSSDHLPPPLLLSNFPTFRGGERERKREVLRPGFDGLEEEQDEKERVREKNSLGVSNLAVVRI